MRLFIAMLTVVAVAGVTWSVRSPAPAPMRLPTTAAVSPAHVATAGAAGVPARAAAVADSGFRFQTPLEYQFRRGEGFHDPEAIAIADIDGDGRDDLIGAARYNQILVWRQRPDGTLADLATHVFADDVYLNRGELVVADFDSDGIADVATSGLRREVWGVDHDVINLLLSNRGGPSVQRQASLARVERLNDWQVMDVDRDNRWDIVGSTSHFFPPGTQCGLDGTLDPTLCPAIGVAYGDGRGGFSRYEAFLIGMPYGIFETEVGDVDGDGLRDLIALAPRPFVFGTTRQQDVWVFRQRRSGGFEPRATLHTLRGEIGTVSIAAGHADGDADHRADTLSVSLDSILRAHPQGAPGQSLPVYDPFTPYDRRVVWSNAFLAEDIDGDRRADAIASQMQWMGDFGIPQIAVYPQRNGMLQTPFYIDAPQTHSGLTNRTLAVGDLNGDGCRDLAVAGANYRLALLYGTGCTLRRPIAAQGRGIAGQIPRFHVRERIPLRPSASPEAGRRIEGRR